MFVYNVKVNGSRLFRIIFICMLTFLVIILGIVCFKIFKGAAISDETCLSSKGVCKINSNNYTNVLKTVHDNIDEYVGVKINFTGYVYRVIDLNDNQFILARDMVISSDFQSVIVGFLCECENTKDFEDNTWVEITGTIYKGDYHGAMPIVKVTSINRTNKPNDELVYPPDESYIPTSGIL